MRRLIRSFWLPLQIATVAALFVGAILAILQAGKEVVSRERRRSEALVILARADDALAVRGARALDVVPEWPESLEPEDWATLDSWLQAQASEALTEFPNVGGGYYVSSFDRYLGHAGLTKQTQPMTRRPSRLAAFDLPARERDLIDDQVSEALELDAPVERVVETPPDTVALRASPLRINGRRVAAIWLLTRLDDVDGLGRSVRSYQWATGLALGGLGLALIVSISLAFSIRRHVAERTALQSEIRRKDRLAALGTLLAGVSHEMRNPLAGLRSAAQLWQRELITNDELANEMIGEVDRLDTIVSHLLMFSKAEPKTMNRGSINEVATEAARLCRSVAESQRISVVENLEPDLPPIRLDPSALLQVFRNLTSNAIDAMPEGGRLTITSCRDSGCIAVIVSDTGPGLSRVVAEHLFEPFYTTKPQGTGLGLAIAREIVLAHGGEISARTGKTGGAEFHLRIPSVGDDFS